MGQHRADVRLHDGAVIEFQHSPISPDKISEREEFYGRDKILWVFDVADAYDENRLDFRAYEYPNTYPASSFRWKSPRKSLWFVEAPMWWDVGSGVIFNVRKLYRELPCAGWGIWRNAKTFAMEITMRAEGKSEQEIREAIANI